MPFLKIILFFLLITSCSCKQMPYFSSANDSYKTPGVVFVLGGEKKTGNISISLETGRNDINYLKLETNGIEEKIKIDSILYFTVKENTYFPKYVRLYFDGPENLLFVKELSTPNSKIKFYELFIPKSTSENDREERYHFLSFPWFNRLESMNALSSKLVPNFSIKMSGFLKDCPALAEKIRAERDGYVLPHFNLSISKRVETYLRIINEYNECR